MTDGTYEQKLDEILKYLYDAFIESHNQINNKGETTINLGLATKYNTEILNHLQSKFARLNYNVNGFLDRLFRDNYVMVITKENEGGSKVYKLSPQGVDLIESGDSYVKMAENEKEKRELEIKLLKSQNEANTSAINTNENIKETNANARKTNSTMLKILLFTTLISIVGAGTTILTLNHEYDKDHTEHTIRQNDSIIKSQQEQILQMKHEMDSIKKMKTKIES